MITNVYYVDNTLYCINSGRCATIVLQQRVKRIIDTCKTAKIIPGTSRAMDIIHSICIIIIHSFYLRPLTCQKEFYFAVLYVSVISLTRCASSSAVADKPAWHAASWQTENFLNSHVTIITPFCWWYHWYVIILLELI